MTARTAAAATVELSLVDRITGPIRRLQARIASLSRSFGLDRIGRAAGNLGRNLSALGDGLGHATRRLSMLTGALGIGGAGAVFGAFKLAQHTAALGDEIAKTARQLGIGAEALQEYRYAAEMSGVSSEALEKGMKRFGANAADAARGTKTYSREFDALGVSLRDAGGNMKSMDQLFNETVEAIASIESPMERTRISMVLFGRAGQDMTRMFEQGADGIRRQREEARRTGHVLSQNASEFSEVFGDNIARLQKRLEGIANMIGVHLMPVMDEMVVRATEWFDANAKLVRSTIAGWAKRLSNVLRALLDPTSSIRMEISRLADGFSGFIDRIRPVIDFLGGPGQAAFVAVAAWITGPLVAAVALLSASFIKLGVVILSTPVGWILGGLALVGAAAYVLVQKWDEFVAYWANLWTRITDAFDKGFLQGMAALWLEFNPLVHVARGLDAVVKYFTGFSLLDAGAGVIASFAEGIGSGLAAIYEWLAEIGGQFAAFMEGLFSRFYGWGAAIIGALWDGLKSKMKAVVGWFKESINGLVGWLPESLQKRIGFDVSAVSNVEGPAAPTADVAPRPVLTAPPIAPMALPAFTAPDATPQKVQTDKVEAANVTAASAEFPEPITVHQPQTVNAPFNVNFTINGRESDANEIASVVKRTLANEVDRQRQQILSRLND
ncbi:phage tail tape measure protein [Mesorhizobium xinjiangense]|uniref:hypothetical protein n=1 Tax=Mesorhizobium xinjiangense TaxID=2678685 RepID=UPI0012EE31D7|nr:hypothetical protein [Mesorhizobium xinjiangense]